MALFCQFWYWYPLAHCACLAFEPTAIIGLNGDLKAPRFDFVSNAKPSLFAYPAPTKPPKKEAVSKVATAVLSTTAKVKAREKKKAAAENDIMDTDEKVDLTRREVDGDVEMKDESEPSSKHGDISPINGSISNLADDGKASTSRLSRKPEPSFEILPNFSRVTPSQLPYVTFPSEGRYQPVRMISSTVSTSGKTPNSPHGLAPEKYAGGGGILILADLQPEEETEFIEFVSTIVAPPAEDPGPAHLGNGHAIHAPQPTGPHIALDDAQPEADPPEPFEYPFGD